MKVIQLYKLWHGYLKLHLKRLKDRGIGEIRRGKFEASLGTSHLTSDIGIYVVIVMLLLGIL